MRRTPIYDLCLAIQFIPQEFSNLQVTREEFQQTLDPWLTRQDRNGDGVLTPDDFGRS